MFSSAPRPSDEWQMIRGNGVEEKRYHDSQVRGKALIWNSEKGAQSLKSEGLVCPVEALLACSFTCCPGPDPAFWVGLLGICPICRLLGHVEEPVLQSQTLLSGAGPGSANWPSACSPA